MEPLATVLTGVGPGVRVNEQVCGQRGRPLEALATDLTVKASFLQRRRKGEEKCIALSAAAALNATDKPFKARSPLILPPSI